MRVVKDAVKSMREVLPLADKVDRTGELLSELVREMREPDRRTTCIEAIIEVARPQSPNPD